MQMVVTGGAGFVGSTLVRLAVQAGHSVVNLDALTASASLADIWDLEDSPDYTLIPTDVTDRRALNQVLADVRPDVVIHLAQAGPHSLMDDPENQLIHTNVMGMETLLRSCRGQNVPRIVLAHGVAPPPGVKLTAYRASQESARLVARALIDADELPVIETFAPTCFGPRQSPADPVAMTVRRMAQGRKVAVPDGPMTAVDMIYVDDYAEGLIKSAEQGVLGGAYKLTGPRKIRPLGVVRRIAKAMNKAMPNPERAYADCIDVLKVARGTMTKDASLDHAQLILGETSFEDAFAQTIAWMVETGALDTRKRSRAQPDRKDQAA